MEDGIFNTPEARQALEDWRNETARRVDPIDIGKGGGRKPAAPKQGDRRIRPDGTRVEYGGDSISGWCVSHGDKHMTDAEWLNYGKVTKAEGKSRVEVIAQAMRPLGDLRAELRNTYLVKGWIDQGAASTIYGESNVGKTFLALDMGLHVAAGEDWHGNRVAQGLVIYAAAEGGRGIVNRLEAFKKDRPELAKAAADRFILLPLTLDLCAPGDAQAFVDALGDLRPALVVVDTLARSMGAGDENTAKDMGQFIANVDFIRAETGAHVLVIHHSGKDTTRGARGSGALRGAVDTEIELTRADSVITATTRKQRDMPGDAAFNYTLRSVFLGYDEDGDAVTSCVVEPTEAAPKRGPKITGQAKIALQAFGDALAHHGIMKTGDLFPTDRQCVSLDHWRAFCDGASLSSGESESANRKAFHDAKRKLQEAGVICIAEGFAWRVSE